MGLLSDLGLDGILDDVADIRKELAELKNEVQESVSDIDKGAKKRVTDIKKTVNRPFSALGAQKRSASNHRKHNIDITSE